MAIANISLDMPPDIADKKKSVENHFWISALVKGLK